MYHTDIRFNIKRRQSMRICKLLTYLHTVKRFLKNNYTSHHIGQALSQGSQVKKSCKGGGLFPGGLVVKDPPANAGDTSSIPDPGRSHLPRSNEAHEPQLLSLCSRARKPQLQKPVRPRQHPMEQERPPQREAHILQLEGSPAHCNWRKAWAAIKAQQK